MNAVPSCYFGSNQPPPDRLALRAGPLTMYYEPGELRYIRLGEREVVRRIYVAVRDQNWDTVPATIDVRQFDVGHNCFHLEFTARHIRDEIDFRWTGKIKGDADGTITFCLQGKAWTTFLRNRIGFCVLHPIHEIASAPCRVETTAGVVTEAFPRYIASENPFREIRAMEYSVGNGVSARLEFTGDLFETEDQRNWIDASFKTFCTPLRLHFPVEVRAETQIDQSVTLRLKGAAEKLVSTAAGPVLSVGKGGGSVVPMIGLSQSETPLTGREAQRLARLTLGHLRTEVHLSHDDWRNRWDRAVKEARVLAVPLEVAVFVSEEFETELMSFVAALDATDAPVRRWLIHHESQWGTERRWLIAARRLLRNYSGGTPVFAGTHGNFCELNRGRVPVELVDGVCFSAQPQEHAQDHGTLVENCAALFDALESARQFCGRLPIAVTPLTLRKRVNPYATASAAPPIAGELPSTVDPRQVSLLGAGWTLGSLKYLAEAGVDSVTIYETTGWRGVMENESGTPLPNLFPSRPGMVFPMYHVLADVGEFAGAEVLLCESTRPLEVHGLALRQNGATRLILANLAPERTRLSIRGIDAQVRLRVLDESAYELASQQPEKFREGLGVTVDTSDDQLEVTLPPLAYARLDW